MIKYYVLFNSLAGKKGENEKFKTLDFFNDKQVEFTDMTTITDYNCFFSEMESEDVIVICGGDGTLNRFVNDINVLPANDIYYYPTGNGNDFWRDLDDRKEGKPYRINEYLVNLPYVEVNDVKKYFINNVGFGIDGYCCEVGDKQKEEKPDKKVNYTKIAIMGLLFNFKPVNAEIIVDGKSEKYENVWLAPTMNGKFYGGGMMPTPSQNRLNPEGLLSVMVFHGKSKLKTLTIFPKIFKGEHIKHEKSVKVLSGKEITVRFDRPTALQIDGETILNVIEYTAYSGRTELLEVKCA